MSRDLTTFDAAELHRRPVTRTVTPIHTTFDAAELYRATKGDDPVVLLGVLGSMIILALGVLQKLVSVKPSVMLLLYACFPTARRYHVERCQHVEELTARNAPLSTRPI